MCFIYAVALLTLDCRYNMFGHFKFCITLIGGYLLFHDPLSLNQVSPALLLLISKTATIWLQCYNYLLQTLFFFSFRHWGSSVLWQEFCLTLISSWSSRRRERVVSLKDRRLSSSRDACYWLSTVWPQKCLYIFLYYNYEYFWESTHILPKRKCTTCTTYPLSVVLAC